MVAWSAVRSVLIGLAACAASALLAACGPAENEDSPLPDLQWLVDAYEHPTAELDLNGARERLEEALPALRSVHAVENIRFALQSLGDVSNGLVIKGLDQELRADIDGYANVNVICPGAQANPKPDAQRDGTLDLHVLIREAAILPVITGEAKRCQIHELPEGVVPAWLLRSDERFRAQLDGALAIHTGAPLVLGRKTQLQPIVRIDGRLTVADLLALDHFDFRVPAEDRFELRLPIGAQHVIIALSSTAVSIRERRGEWVCEPETEGACTPMF